MLARVAHVDIPTIYQTSWRKRFLNVIDKSVFEIDTLWASFYTKSVVDWTEVIVAYMGPAETMNTSLSPFNTAYDNDYDWSSCFSCNLRHSHEHSVVLKLTGQCSKSVFETYYHLELDNDGDIMFHGFTGTIIKYDGENKMWKMSVIQVPYASATSKADFETLILGNHEWEVQNDVDCYDGAEVKTLTMSSCSTDLERKRLRREKDEKKSCQHQ